MRYFVPLLPDITVIKTMIYLYGDSGEMVPLCLDSLMFVMPAVSVLNTLCTSSLLAGEWGAEKAVTL